MTDFAEGLCRIMLPAGGGGGGMMSQNTSESVSNAGIKYQDPEQQPSAVKRLRAVCSGNALSLRAESRAAEGTVRARVNRRPVSLFNVFLKDHLPHSCLGAHTRGRKNRC